MGGLALLARALGHRVCGSDERAYPPMSEVLRSAGIAVAEGYDPAHLHPAPECVVIGNVLTRGNPAVEHVLNDGLAFTSGPQWLAENVLTQRTVLAVSGTHGKTSTASMLAFVLDRAGREPGFLIGGVPVDFGVSARLGARDAPFVVEADEYDSAFFDKRSKFVHYLPRTLVINNIEFDHADIFDDLAAIRRQFHHLVRNVPGAGLIVRATPEEEIDRLLALGCWTPIESFGLGAGDWAAREMAPDGSAFDVCRGGIVPGRVEWDLVGRHNVMNALAAISAASRAGVDPAHAIRALGRFRGVKRRLEVRGCVAGIRVYDDFAHHPSAIATTLEGLRARVGPARILAVLDLASNTMRGGVHRDAIAPALSAADVAWVYRRRELDWDPGSAPGHAFEVHTRDATQTIVDECAAAAEAGDHILVMSNRHFEEMPERLLAALADRAGARIETGTAAPPRATLALTRARCCARGRRGSR